MSTLVVKFNEHVITSRFYKFAKIAFDLAQESDSETNHLLCAMVIKRNRVLSVGYNSRKTSPKMKTKMMMMHAECDAVLRCHESDLAGADIIVARARSSGRPGLAKPCPTCESVLKSAGIRRAIYTLTSDNCDSPEIEVMRL